MKNIFFAVFNLRHAQLNTHITSLARFGVVKEQVDKERTPPRGLHLYRSI